MQQDDPSRSAANPEGCLFCRAHDGGFTSEEHIFPRSLGNTDFVLPAGVVCDRCNHGPLAKVDQALSSFPPIELLRAERGLGTRNGDPLVVTLNGTKIWWEGRGELRVLPGSPGVIEHTGPNTGQLNLTNGRATPARIFQRLTHAVWKIAIEDMYRDRGPGEAFDPKYDPARQAVIGRRDISGWCLAPTTGTPHTSVAIHRLDYVAGDREHCSVSLDVFGMILMTDLVARDLARDEIHVPDPVNFWTFGR